MTIYADTCWFVSLYLTDRHTAEVERRLSSRPEIWMTPLHVAEWMHAVEQHVFRKSLARNQADRLIQRFSEHCTQGLWKGVPVPDGAWEICAQLAERYTARFGTRTLDTLHVASALELKASYFWTFDRRQSDLAEAVGLKIK